MKKDLIGLKFGKLLVLSKTELRSKGGKVIWKCQCDCGNLKNVQTDYLTCNQTTSCGCYQKETTSKRFSKHNAKNSENKRLRNLYTTWLSMRDRCNNPNNINFKHYGGRGISVCNEWNDFNVFKNDMGYKPIDGNKYTLERIDVNGNYCKENCKWATYIEQANNRRNNRAKYTIDNKEYSIRDIIDITGLSYESIRDRIEANLNPFKPKTKAHRAIEFNGIVLSIIDWSKKLNVSKHILYRKLRYNQYNPYLLKEFLNYKKQNEKN